METINAIGRRKAAVARVFVKEAKKDGEGVITINKKELAQYFPSGILQFIVKQPLAKLGVEAKYDIKIARALVKINPEDKPALKSEGFMTRDPRSVERKKPGRPKARKRFQFSKR